MSRHGPSARTTRRTIDASARDVFDFLTTIANHGWLIPLTRIDAPDRPARVGDVVTAVSVGVLRDVMVVTDRSAHDDGAMSLTLVKAGPILHGWARIAVRALTAGTCEVSWEEAIHLRGTNGRLLTRAGAIMTARALARTARLI